MRWLGVLIGMFPLAALAENDLEQAQRLISEMQYGRANTLADKTLQSASSGPTELATAYRIRGLCLASLGRTREAVDAFRRMLAIVPDMTLSPKTSPKLKAPFEQAAALATKEKPLSLSHTAPAPPSSLGGASLTVLLEANPFKMVSAVQLLYQVGEGKQQKVVAKLKASKTFTWKLPETLKGSDLRYRFEAINPKGGVLARAGSVEQPFVLAVAARTEPAAAPVEAPVVAVATEPVGEPPATILQPESKPPVVSAVPSSAELKSMKSDERKESSRWYTSWWFWTGVGVVAAGVATGVILAVGAGDEGGPIHYEVTLR